MYLLFMVVIFQKDNSDKDDKIEQEINEILHDKERLLSLDNPRRFIFLSGHWGKAGITLTYSRFVSYVRAVAPHLNFKK